MGSLRVNGLDEFRSRFRRVRFLPYGIVGRLGPRRLDRWQRSAPDPDRASQLWLGHDAADASCSVVVGTVDPNERLAGSYDLADEATFKLINIGLPTVELSRPAGFITRLVDYARDLAAGCEEWPTLPVTVDHQPATFRYVRFAGCWAGVVDDHRIVVYSDGNEASSLSLVQYTDTSAYGFDGTAGVRFVDQRAPAVRPQREDWHADHRSLFSLSD